jgi:hypothetical protein
MSSLEHNPVKDDKNATLPRSLHVLSTVVRHKIYSFIFIFNSLKQNKRYWKVYIYVFITWKQKYNSIHHRSGTGYTAALQL